jgi:hypothetical protein
MRHLGPFYFQYGFWGCAFAIALGDKYYCVELRRDQRHRS